jgi:transcriptional regulator with XRE-family HTH domain
MAKTLGSPRHEALRKFIIQKRKSAGLTQHQAAKALKRTQSFVATIETGQRRIDVVELLDLAEVYAFNPHAALKQLKK